MVDSWKAPARRAHRPRWADVSALICALLFACSGSDGENNADLALASGDTAGVQDDMGSTQEGEGGDLSGSTQDPTQGARPTRELAGGCDPLVPAYCLLPFPSDVYLVDDPSLPSGRRVELPLEGLPGQTRPEALRLSDGFSAGGALLAYFPGASVTGVATPDSIPASLQADSPTVLLQADTLERVPHFAELDMSDPEDPQQAFMIRPTVRLKDETRYIVAIRNLVDLQGVPLEASPAFTALRDGSDSEEPSVNAGRALYEELFDSLQEADVAREELLLAWEFTTASAENNTRWMLSMRDEALAEVREAGPDYRIDQVQDDVDAHIARRIDLTMTVPLYLDDPGPGGRLVLDDQGMPIRQGTADYPVVITIPHAAREAAPGIIQLGHGLLGSREQALGLAEVAAEQNMVVMGVDWIGMASDDLEFISGTIAGGDFGQMKAMVDRLQQGILNFLLSMRMAIGALAQDPVMTLQGGVAPDASRRYYYGGSQGGIYGAVVMALSTDVERGVLAVPGQPYNLLLNRSVDFDAFLQVLRLPVPDAVEVQLALGLLQMLWDRAEPSGYSHTLRAPLPDTPGHEVLVMAALGDQQVSNLGAHIMARAMDIPLLMPAVRSVQGLREVTGPIQGSAFVEYDFGNPPDPLTNVPPREGDDPHGKLIEVVPAVRQAMQFLQTGRVEHFCEGVCDPD